MKIAFVELGDWHEEYLRRRIDSRNEVVAFRDVLDGALLPQLADADVV